MVHLGRVLHLFSNFGEMVFIKMMNTVALLPNQLVVTVVSLWDHIRNGTLVNHCFRTELQHCFLLQVTLLQGSLQVI